MTPTASDAPMAQTVGSLLKLNVINQLIIRIQKIQMSLSVEQQQAFDQFKQGHNLVITGPGGVGKTKLIAHFVEYANSIGTKIQVCAMTGCASLLLGNNAKTIHSWSGI